MRCVCHQISDTKPVQGYNMCDCSSEMRYGCGQFNDVLCVQQLYRYVCNTGLARQLVGVRCQISNEMCVKLDQRGNVLDNGSAILVYVTSSAMLFVWWQNYDTGTGTMLVIAIQFSDVTTMIWWCSGNTMMRWCYERPWTYGGVTGPSRTTCFLLCQWLPQFKVLSDELKWQWCWLWLWWWYWYR
jgi:hypothetical protein